MKKHILLLTNLTICLILLLGFGGMFLINYQSYNAVMTDDIENISKLTSSNIYAQIDNELTKPIFVAQTMANDSFLKGWLESEAAKPDDAQHRQELQKYLYAYRMKYEYDSVFMISAQSSVYYYFDGINKLVQPENEHDDWYYDFVESGAPYRLNIDTDEVNQKQLTVFVDCRIEAADGTLLGVTGVGLKMSRLQELLGQYEQEYDLEAFLMNPQGNITVDTDTDKIEAVNLFDDPNLTNLRDQILGNRSSMEMHWYPEDSLDNCIITRYVENMDWYLVIQKNTRPIRMTFERLLRQDAAIIGVLLVLLLSLSTGTIQWYNRRMRKSLNTDSLTGLPNQQAFSEAFQSHNHSGSILFLFDIDRFKRINDTKGHLFGNLVLAAIGDILRDRVGRDGIAARWGGDEFIGLLNVPRARAEEILTGIASDLEKQREAWGFTVTISIGADFTHGNHDMDIPLEKCDQALYTIKDRGGNQLCFSGEEDAGKADPDT